MDKQNSLKKSRKLVKPSVKRQKKTPIVTEVNQNPSPEPFFVYDENGHIIEANAVFCAKLGYSRDELLKKTIFNIEKYAQKKTFKETIFQLAHGGQDIVQKIYKCKDGSLFYAEAHSQVFILDYKKYILCILRELISVNEAIELGSFPEENPNPVFRVDASGKIIYCNAACKKFIKTWNVEKTMCVPEDWKSKVKKILAEKKVVFEELLLADKKYSLALSPAVKRNFVNVYLYDITTLKTTKEELAYKANTEAFMAEVSKELSERKPEDLNIKVKKLLAKLARFLQVDRVYLHFLLEESNSQFYEWKEPGIKTFEENFDLGEVDCFRKKIKGKPFLIIDGLAIKCPCAQRVIRKRLANGVKSMLLFILRQKGKTLGFLEIDIVEKPVPKWKSENLTFLTLFGELIVESLRQQGYDEKIFKNQRALERSLMAAIEAIIKTLEARDIYTIGHERNVSKIAEAIAREMKLPESQVEGIRLGSLVHDIGKAYIPSEILNKPSPLNKVEFELVKTHPDRGYETIKNIEFPWPVKNMVYQHHERMDGSGYPKGLVGKEICLEARILAVADVIDAMTSDRPYRKQLTMKDALKELKKDRGTLYDPDVVDACVRLFEQKEFKI